MSEFLQKEVDRLTIEVEVFERKYFEQKKRIEMMQDMNETFRENILDLTSAIKNKDEEIKKLKLDIDQMLSNSHFT